MRTRRAGRFPIHAPASSQSAAKPRKPVASQVRTRGRCLPVRCRPRLPSDFAAEVHRHGESSDGEQQEAGQRFDSMAVERSRRTSNMKEIHAPTEPARRNPGQRLPLAQAGPRRCRRLQAPRRPNVQRRRGRTERQACRRRCRVREGLDEQLQRSRRAASRGRTSA